MGFQEKILSKSNSYRYYKQRNEILEKENESLKAEIDKLKNKEDLTLIDQFNKDYPNSSGFCNWSYIDYFFKDDFEDRLKAVTKNLDHDSKLKYKWILLRALSTNVLTRDSLYFYYELDDQKKFTDFKINNSNANEIAGFKFTGEYNLHAFIDLNLTSEDKEFLKDKDIIDAGAYTGDTSLPLSKVTEKNVYAFEPFEDSYNILNKNIKDNNIDNIVPEMKSLGNINGSRSLYLSGQNVQGITSNPEARNYDRELKVDEVTIDQYVEDNNLNVGFITVDVEGAEMDLLEGAINTLKTQRPILHISIYHKVTDFFEIIPWIANLDLNYEFKVFKEQPWPFLADTVVQCRPK